MTEATPQKKSTTPSSSSPVKSPSANSGGTQLNPSAKSFVPKMDGAELQKPQPHHSPNRGGGGNVTTPNVPTMMAGHPGMMVPSPLARFGQPMMGPMGVMGPSPMMMMSPNMGVMPGRPQGMPFPGMMVPGMVSPTVPSSASQGGPHTPLSGSGSIPTPTMFNAPPSPSNIPNVQVGNAQLAQSRSQQPPKFACVLLSGVPGVGKTTLGRQLVQELQEDKLGWEFFSGGDHLKDTPSKPQAWETTKTVLDSLSETLDVLLKNQQTNPIRGLLIDKQCRGVEDLYYLTSLLRGKGLLLWGVLGMDVASDDILATRVSASADSGFKEKIKYYRVIQSRICDSAKAVHLWHPIDCSGSRPDVVKSLRTMVLGCSSQSPTKQFNYTNYIDCHASLVDNYSNYSSIMTNLFTHIHVKAGKAAPSFPGFSSYIPLPASALDERKGLLKEYVVRRKVDGTKYILFFDGVKLYLIPRHMRCVLEMPTEAWLGVHLSATGKFVLDGDLVKVSKERTKEKFVVYDALYWAEKGSTFNLLSRAPWKERQGRLKTNLCAEPSAFFPKKVDIVVVHQICEELKRVHTLTEPCDYATEGLVFQPVGKQEKDPIYLWRPPENVTVDFRLGPIVSHDSTTVVFSLEVFDQKQAKYVQFRNDTVDVPGRKNIVEGTIVACGLEPTNDSLHWVYLRPRCDIQIASFKANVEDLLKNCLITKQGLLDFFGTGDLPPQPQQQQLTMATASTAVPQFGMEQQPPKRQQQLPIPGGLPPPNTSASRQAFGSALPAAPQQQGTPPFQQPLGSAQKEDLMTDAQKLSAQLSVTVKVQQIPNANSNVTGSSVSAIEKLSSLMNAGIVHGSDDHLADAAGEVARKEKSNKEGSQQNNTTSSSHKERSNERKCGGCRLWAEGSVDSRNNVFYCYECWAVEGVEYCEDCGNFGKGGRTEGTRRHRGEFYCDACWIAYEKKSGNKRPAKTTTHAASEDSSNNTNQRSSSTPTAAKEIENNKENDVDGKGKQSNGSRTSTPPAEPVATKAE